MASLGVLLIILGCGAYQYFKGSIFKAVTTIVITTISSAAAFGFFEILADYFISKGSESKYPALVPWAQPLCFALLFVLVFAILQTVAMQLSKLSVDFGQLPERIGRPILGVFLGLVLSGLLLTVLAMAPLPNKYPYQRFDDRQPKSDSPTKALLNVDGLATGWFSLMSRGSFGAIRKPTSFAAAHPSFLDELYLNRHSDSDEVTLIAKEGSIDVARKQGVWYAPATGLSDSEGKVITSQPGHTLVVVRLTILRNALKDAGKFTPAQLRLVCVSREAAQAKVAPKAKNAYPIGYFSGASQITEKKLSEVITITRSDFPGNEVRKDIDFVFNVPSDYTPIALQFKQNCILQIPKPVSSEQAPPASPFVEKAEVRTSSSLSDNDSSSSTTNPDSSNVSSRPDVGRRVVERLTTGGNIDETE
ncbi:MAG: CvpA family protein [Sedimentisphaerales bacterium]|nr:CvpA family protein [Sedimentisphaerales bacterium]